MSDQYDPSELDQFYDDLTDEVIDEETAPRTGLQVPEKVTLKAAKFNTAAGEVSVNLQTWEETVEITKVSMKPHRADNPLRAYGGATISIGTIVSRDYPSPNRGRFPEFLQLKIYPGLFNTSDEELERIKASAPEKTPLKYIKSRKFENQRSHRLLGSLVAAAGYKDRLTKGGGLRIPAILDLLANNGALLAKTPLVAVIQKGEPEWNGTVPDHKIIAFKVKGA